MAVRVATVIFWFLLWGLSFASFLYDRYLRSLMEPDPSLADEPTGEQDSMRVKGVKMSWSRSVTHSPWENMTWEEKMGYLRRRSYLNWATAGAGVGVLFSFVLYARDEMELIRAVTEGKAPEVALQLVNRPEVIVWLVVLAIFLASLLVVKYRERKEAASR